MSIDDFDPQYLVTLDEIYHSHWIAKKRRRMAILRQAVDAFWPDGHSTRLIHITGTNGKGSVAHYLTQGLGFAGATGSWTGPHVFDYAERFHINGEPASHAEIAAIYRSRLAPYQDAYTAEHPDASLSFAELGILLALHLFQRHEVVWAAMEVGAGGRYTPLMGLDMHASLLTNIGHDHPKTLGAKPWQRAMEKAGIARPGQPFFTADQGETLAYVCATAAAEGAEVHVLEDRDLADLPPGPDYQRRNQALACKVIRHFYPEKGNRDLAQTMTARLPGRFGFLRENVVADVAHNPDKMARLAERLEHTYPGETYVFLVGLTRERESVAVFAPIMPLAKHIIITGASYAGIDPHEIMSQLRDHYPQGPSMEVIAEPQEAYQHGLTLAVQGTKLILTGSAYMIEQAANPNPFIRHLNASYGWRTTESTSADRS